MPEQLPEQSFTLGKHVKLDGDIFLPVRFVDQQTLHEEPSTGDTFIEFEKFVELRNRAGVVRFASLTSSRSVAKRDSGPCRGIKPYFWKGQQNGQSDETVGIEGVGEGGGHTNVDSGEGEVVGTDDSNRRVE